MTAGIRFNDPTAKYMYFDMDMENMKLVVYLTGVNHGNEITLKGTITQSGWSLVQGD